MADIFVKVLDVAEMLMALGDDLNGLKKKRRNELVELCEKSSASLVRISRGLRTGRIPHGKLNNLIFGMEDLRKSLLPVLDKDAAKPLEKILAGLCEPEEFDKILKKCCDAKSLDTCLRTIDEAAGKYLVLASLVDTH